MDQFLAEIRLFPYNFAPQGWADCNGQILPISQNTALFSLLGTMYGGDGRTTFALPNLRDSVAMGAGSGAGLTPRVEGETGGAASVALLVSEIPQHTHLLNARDIVGDDNDAVATAMLARPSAGNAYGTGGPMTMMAPAALALAGGDGAHENRQPHLVLRYCIALQGIFPPRG